MHKLFSFTEPIFAFLTKLADLMIVSVLWTAFSLPLFTIGASTAALYRVMLNLKDDTIDSAVRQFWEAFKTNFIAGTKVMLLALPAYMIIGFNTWVLLTKEVPQIVAIACVASAVVLGLCLVYIFPLTALFDNKAKTTIMNSCILALSNPLRSLFVLVMNLLPFLLFIFFPYAFLYALPIWFLLGVGVVALVNVSVFRKILAPLMEKVNTKENPEK